jgi:predicted flap endonuclease-1-like 5' DNA nuclease
MQYLIVTYWMWFVVALLAGGVVVYWLPWRLDPAGRMTHPLLWGAAAFLAGLAAAVLHWLPRRAGLYLETLLLLSFWYAIGGLLGGWLRAAASRAELANAALASHAQAESAVLGARAKAAVRSVQDSIAQDSAASTKAMEDARLDVEAKAAEVVRIAAAAKAAEERLAAEARAAEEARAAAAAKAVEDARLAVEAKAAELARVAAAAKAAEDKAAAEERLATEAKAVEEARAAAAAKAAEDKAAEEERRATEAKAAEEARVAEAAKKAAEDARLAAEAKAAEQARLAAAVKAVQQERRATEAKAAEETRVAAAAKAAQDKASEEPAVAATTAPADEVHPGSKPQGIAAPAEGEADDLKLIKGIGPKNEKACHALGIYQFRQIADWTAEEAIWVGHHIAFPGRIEREHWIAQAKLLASGGETEHSRAVKSGAIAIDDKADEPLDPAAAEMLGQSLPEQAAAVDGEGKHPGRRPYGLATALGKADNLKRIRGIGPQNEGRLHGLGIWHFSQIAAWTDENVKWVGSYLAFSGRIHRENWVAQARDLAAGKETESPRRASRGKVAASKDEGSLGEGDVRTLK